MKSQRINPLADQAIAPNWETRTLPDGTGQLTNAMVGNVTIGGTTSDVVLSHDPNWFTRGRAKGRPEDIIAGPDFATGPFGTVIGYHVETRDVSSARYLGAALDAFLYFRPHLAPTPEWKTRTRTNGHAFEEARLGLVVTEHGHQFDVCLRFDTEFNGATGDYEPGDVIIRQRSDDNVTHVTLPVSDLNDVDVAAMLTRANTAPGGLLG